MMRRRLTVTTVLAVLLALVVLTVGFYLLLSVSLERDADAVLRARGEAALASVELRGGSVAITDSAGDRTTDATTWVFGPRAAVVLKPATTRVALADAAKLAAVPEPTFVTVPPQTRLLAEPVPGAAPRDATIVVSLSLAPYERSEQIALLSAVALDLAILAVLAAVTRWLVGAALRPVDRMTRQAQDWLAHDADRRFEIATSTPDEVGRLGSTLNDMLARLASSLRHERRLTDEIAHELRTPLARARAEAEVSAHSSDPTELRSALAAVVVDIDEISVTVDTLLRSTRAPAATGARCTVADAVRGAVAAVQFPVPVTIEATASSLAVGCEETLVRRILAPQLDNAGRHATTGVRVRWSLAGDGVHIEVLDDGPGLHADETERVFAPGQRGSAAHEGPGSGLGLALARRLARSCGGDAIAEPGPGGRFITRLPAA